jgi:transposase-like protein
MAKPPLDPVYPVVFFDALRVKIRDEGMVRNKAVYVALALNPDGEKEVLGLWIEQTEDAKFWLKVINDLKTRGVNSCATDATGYFGKDDLADRVLGARRTSV